MLCNSTNDVSQSDADHQSQGDEKPLQSEAVHEKQKQHWDENEFELPCFVQIRDRRKDRIENGIC